MPEVRRRRRRRRTHGWRRWARWLRKHRLAAALAGPGCLVVLWIAWSFWLAAQVRGDLAEVREEAQVMRAALVRGDAGGARRALERYQHAAESAERRTSGITWSGFEHVPFLGDDAHGVALVSRVLADIGRDGLPPVADAAELVTADTFQPRDKVFPVERIAAMEEPAQRSQKAFESAAERLATVDADGFVGPIHDQFEELSSLVGDARTTLGSTYRAARLLPRMMGEDRPRDYLLVLQNNAELRSGGGLPGALSLVRMRAGRVDIVEQADMAEIGTRVPVVELTDEERRIFGDILDQAAVDATLTPDFPRAAEIVRSRWERARGGRVDGVFFVDPVAVSYLLRGTGPVPLPGYPPVRADSVVAAVENEVYLQTEDREVHSDYQQAVSKAVFDVFANGGGNTAESIRGLVAAVMEGRVRMHSFSRKEQAEIAGTEIAGEFVDRGTSDPEVGIYLNDAGPTKMQYYLKYDAAVFARRCIGSRQEITGSIEFRSDTPPDVEALPPSITGEGFPGQRVLPGDQQLVVYLTSPTGGEITEIKIDGQRAPDPVREPLAGRTLTRMLIHLAPRARHRVEFVMRSGLDQDGDVRLRVTPGVFPGSSNRTVRSSCEER